MRENQLADSTRELLPVSLRHWIVSRTLVAGLALGCYINSCWGNFVFDDSEAVVSNEDVDPGVSTVAEVFSHDFWGSNISSKTSHKSYRPLTVLTYRLSFWLAGGRRPFHFHLANVLLHPIVCLLLLEVLDCWLLAFKSNTSEPSPAAKRVGTVSLVAGLLFAVHPVHTESVSGVVGRAELTSALFFMASLLLYMHCSTSGRRDGMCVSIVYSLATLVLAACAMLFKEQGITVLGMCVVYDIVFHIEKVRREPEDLSWEGLKAVCIRVAVLCVGGAILVWARFTMMVTGAPRFKPIDNPASFAEAWTTRTLSYNYVYAINWWLLFHPWWLCFDWSMGCVPLPHSLADPRTAATIVFWVGLGTISCWTLCRFLRKEGGGLVALSLSLMVLPFLPASNLLFRVGFVVAERVLYLSSAGHCTLVAIGATVIAAHSSLMKRVVQASLLYLVAIHTLRSVQRSSQWLDEESLFVSGLHVCPLNAKVYYNIGKVLSDAGFVSKGEAAYLEAIRLYPEYDQALNNLANLLKDSDRLLEAEGFLERAIKSNNEFAAAWMNLGIVQAALNKPQAAEESYKCAITHRRQYPDAYYNMGNLYIDIGRPGEAITAFSKAISQQPLHSNAWTNLGLLYEDLHMYKEAETVTREAMGLMPDKPRFYFSLGVLLGKTQRLETAQLTNTSKALHSNVTLTCLLKEGEKYLAKAVEMRPDLAKYHVNLGVIYHMQKRYDLAEVCYETALQLEPSLSSAKDNMKKLQSTLSKLSKHH